MLLRFYSSFCRNISIMHIEHIAIWANQLEILKDFYIKYFNAEANNRYHNPNKAFYSYFLSFEKGARLELMQKPNISAKQHSEIEELGLTHLAFSVGNEQQVNELTEKLRQDGIKIVGEPRRTGDGYYESVVLDPEGNRIEITC